MWKNKNYIRFISGKVISNFGDSVFMQLLVAYFTVQFTNASQLLAINKLLQVIPVFLILFVGVYLDRLKKKKQILVIFEVSLLLFTILLLVVLNQQWSVVYVLSIAGIFYLLNTIKQIAEFSLKKQMVHENDLMNFNRVYRISGKAFDLLADAIGIYLIHILGYIKTVLLNVITFIFSMFQFNRIKEYEVETNTSNTILLDLKEGIKHFFDSKDFSKVVIFDGILSGPGSLVGILMPLYFYDKGVLFTLYPFYLVAKSGGWFIGILVTPKIVSRITSMRNLFRLDYTVQVFFVLCILLDAPLVMLIILACIASIPQAATGVMYDTWAIQAYDEKYIARVGSFITFILSIVTMMAVVLLIVYPNISIKVVAQVYILLLLLINVLLMKIKN